MSTSKQTARKESMQEIMAELEAGVAAVFESDNYIKLLDMMSQFHQYSLNNCILILSQCPSATRCASFATWKKLKMPVKKGEKGIKILVPIPYKYQKEQSSIDDDGNAVTEIVDASGTSFRIGYVFDKQQVNGEFPELCHELTDDSEQLQTAVNRIVTECEYIHYDPELKQGGANGYYRLDNRQIYLRQGMSAGQSLKTIIHEKAHSLLHNSDSEERCTREEAETQAESCAYIVCKRFGLNTAQYSFPYLCSWSSGRELSELKSSLAVIEKTAKELSDWLASTTNLEMIEPA